MKRFSYSWEFVLTYRSCPSTFLPVKRDKRSMKKANPAKAGDAKPTGLIPKRGNGGRVAKEADVATFCCLLFQPYEIAEEVPLCTDPES